MIFKNKNNPTSSLKPGDHHYRAYIGPPRDYDLISAMVFNLLTCIGLRQDHKVLDVGSGSLRVGRLLIPYLSKGCYIGVEPNKWLVKDGIRNEVGKSLIKIKKPIFSYQSSLIEFNNKPLNLDFAFAQSIFSHCGLDLIDQWLIELQFHMKDNGLFLATFLIGDEDYGGEGWVYPGCVKYKISTLTNLAQEYGFNFTLLDWAHPRQQWGVFSKSGIYNFFLESKKIEWINVIKSRYPELNMS